MNWNYRLVKKDVDGAVAYAICEVYYDDDGKPSVCSAPVAPFGSTVEEIRIDLERMAVALSMTTLDESHFTGTKKDENPSPDEVE